MPVLFAWGAASIAAGTRLRRTHDERLRGTGDQFIAWGAVDGLIAVGGIAGAQKSARGIQDGAFAPQQQARQARRFEQIVWINAALDIGYMAGGSALIQRNLTNPYRQGTGWGILVQGAFLFTWDVFLALAIRKYRHDRIA